MNYLIFGVDPGTTVGIAAIDLNGKIIATHSEKHMGLSGVVEYITRAGHPTLIACDVNPPPAFILKLAASLGTPIFSPKKTLKVEEKLSVTTGQPLSDAHQRDALAAALEAFAHYQNKIRKIDAKDLGDEAKKRVFAGEKITPQTHEKKPAENKTKKPKTIDAAAAEGLQRKINQLLEETQLKNAQIKKLEEKITLLEKKAEQAYDSRAKERSEQLSIKTLKSKILELENEITEYQKLQNTMQKMGRGELKPVGVYPQIFGGLTLFNRKIGGDDLEQLTKIKTAFTSIEPNKNILEKHQITTLDPTTLLKIKGSYFAQTDKLNPPQQQKPVNLDQLVSEYRSR